MRDDDRPDLQQLDAVIQQERRLARRLYRRRQPWLPTLVEVGVVAIGAAGLWAAANFDRNADAGALFLAQRQSASPTFTAAASPLPELTADPATQAVISNSATNVPSTTTAKVSEPPTSADEGTTNAPAVQASTAPVVYQGSQSFTAPTTSQVDSYLKRARELVTLGDIAGARLLLSRASEGKDSRALAALAETYDPVVLRGWRVVGIRADQDRARALYQEALKAGNKTAGEHLLAMK